MSQFQITQLYLQCLFGNLFDRVRDDERGSLTAEQLVLIAVAVVGAGVVAGIIWNRLQSSANSVPMP